MFSVILILCLIGMCIQAAFIAVEHKEKYVPAVFLKGSASLIFVVVGFLASRVAQDSSFANLILIGLVFGLIGDVLLNLRFVFEEAGQKIFLVGIVAFLVGHIIYLVAIAPRSQSLVACAIIGAIIATGILTYIFKTMEVKLAFKIFGVFYLGAVIIMTTVAVGNLIAVQSPANIIYAAGAVLFTLSDIVLIFNTFSGTTRFSMRVTNLSLYYVGQLLIALSILY